MKLRPVQLKKMDEFHINAYECLALDKKKIKEYHDWKIKKREFTAVNIVLLFNFMLHLFLRKLILK